MTNSKFYDELKKKQKSILPEKKLRAQIINGACYCSGVLDRDDPLYGACEAAFRRGFMHGADSVAEYLSGVEEIPQDVKDKIDNYVNNIYHWRFDFKEKCDVSCPPNID